MRTSVQMVKNKLKLNLHTNYTDTRHYYIKYMNVAKLAVRIKPLFHHRKHKNT